MDKRKPTIPDVLERFLVYYLRNPVWGSLHVVLEDGNVGTESIVWCQGHATEENDPEGAALAALLVEMSRTQRLKLPSKVREVMKARGLQFVSK